MLSVDNFYTEFIKMNCSRVPNKRTCALIVFGRPHIKDLCVFKKRMLKNLSMIIFKSVSNLESPKISNSLKLMIYHHPYGHNIW